MRLIAMRVIRVVAGMWTLVIAGLSTLVVPSTFRAVGPLSRGQVATIDSTWTLVAALLAVVGVVAMLRDVHIGRWAVLTALGMVTRDLLVLPLISLDVDAGRAYPRLMLFAVVNVTAMFLVDWSCRALWQPETRHSKSN